MIKNKSYRRIINKLKGDDLSAILARSASFSLIIKIIGTAIAFTVQILLARLMGVKYYGDYIYVLAWLNILVLPSKMGWDTLLLKYVAIYKIEKEWGKLKGVLQASSRITFIQCLLIGVITALIIWLTKSKFNQSLFLTFLISLPLLPLLVFNSLRQSTLRSLKRIVLSQTPEMIIRPVCIAILSSSFFLYINNPLNSVLVIIITIIATIISFLIGTYWLNKSLPSSIKNVSAICQNREWIYEAFPLFLISGMYLLLNQTDIIMLGYIIGTKEAGIYSVSSRIATLTIFAMTSIQSIAAPMITELYVSQKHEELQKLVSMSSTAMFVLALPVVILLIFAGDILLSFFGLNFTQANLSLSILASGQLVNAFTGVGGYMMTMTGYQNKAAWIIGVSALLNIGLNWVLIPNWGIEGAAIATTITTCLWNTVFALFVWKYLKIKSIAIF